MMLEEMLAGCTVGNVPLVEISGLQYDSRKLQPGEAFFAFPGEMVDGHVFVDQALAAGAGAVVSERPAPTGLQDKWVQVKHGRQALAHASLRFFDHLDHTLKLTGVTGTNGKTSTVHLIDSLLRSTGKTTASLGTIEHRVGDQVEPAVNTTPESLDVIRKFQQLRDIGGTHVTIEVSSHALSLNRIHGMEFHTAVFTNLTQDHLDYHGDMESYAAAKQILFEGAGARPPRFAVVNLDNATGRELQRLQLSKTLSYGRTLDADVCAKRVESDVDGLRFDVDTPSGQIRVRSALLGDCNVENILAAIAAALCLDLTTDEIGEGVQSVQPVPGRFEAIDEGQPYLVILDYAHTDDALRALLETARTLASLSKQSSRVLTLFGCGGSRDRDKRPAMGKTAGTLSDHVVVTSDNPRAEDPLEIIAAIEAGLTGQGATWTVEPDRAAAILEILHEANSGDVVLLAGKGHETTQKLADRVIEFDDKAVARKMLHQMGYAKP